jgi:ketosteroid isomerase-like protein
MSEQNKKTASIAAANRGTGTEFESRGHANLAAIESPTSETRNSSTERARRAFEAHLAVFDPQSTSNYAELLTDDAVYEFPFAPAAFPSRVEGREAIAEYMTGLPQLAKNWQFRDFTFSATTDPDVFFVEFKGSADVIATKRKYEQIYIGRLEMRGEKMSKYREFWNPQVIVDAFMP